MTSNLRSSGSHAQLVDQQETQPCIAACSFRVSLRRIAYRSLYPCSDPPSRRRYLLPCMGMLHVSVKRFTIFAERNVEEVFGHRHTASIKKDIRNRRKINGPRAHRERRYPGRSISGARLLCVGVAAPASVPDVLAISEPKTPAVLRSLEGRVSGRCNAFSCTCPLAVYRA